MTTTPTPPARVRSYLRTAPFESTSGAAPTAVSESAEPVSPSRPLFASPAPGSNAWAVRSGAIPCETNPHSGELSRLREPFHAQAVKTIGADGTEQRHVCAWCLQHHHRYNKITDGVTWGKVRGKSAIAVTAEEVEEEGSVAQ